MLNSKKIAATAGVLCGFALIGVGAGQAVAHDGSSSCATDGKGNVRCVQQSDYRFTSDKHGNVRVVNKQALECSGGTCESSLFIGGKKVA